jgi:hypothetical protein
MKLPPSLLHVQIKDERRFGIWLPLFLLWPLFLLILIPMFFITFIADSILIALRGAYHRYTRFLYEIILVTFELRNLRVNVNKLDKHVNITFI